jgi:tRNA(Ile)-lysidine synthase
MARGIGWVEDPMNADLRRDRNYLRRVVIPLLQARWPAVSDAVGRSAILASEAATMLAETAAADAAELLRGSRIPVTQFSKLPEHRQRNLIRFVCAELGWAVPPERRLRTGLAQLRAATGERHPLLQWPGGEIRRYRDHLYLINGGLPPMPPPPRAWSWDGAQPLSLAAGSGHVRLVAARGGLASSCLRAGPLTVRFRDGGESLRPVGDVHHRTLKFLFQQSGIVPWMRDRIPLLYQGDRLLAVADLWQAGDAVASGDAMGLQLVWEGHPEIR